MDIEETLTFDSSAHAQERSFHTESLEVYVAAERYQNRGRGRRATKKLGFWGGIRSFLGL